MPTISEHHQVTCPCQGVSGIAKHEQQGDCNIPGLGGKVRKLQFWSIPQAAYSRTFQTSVFNKGLFYFLKEVPGISHWFFESEKG